MKACERPHLTCDRARSRRAARAGCVGWPLAAGRRILWLAPLLTVTPLGCTRTVNMASGVGDPSWVATTIPYAGVREATRQFPDYNSIGAAILAPEPAEEKAKPQGKRGTRR